MENIFILVIHSGFIFNFTKRKMLEILKMRIKGVQCDALLSAPVFIANSNRYSLGKLFFPTAMGCNMCEYL